MTSEEAHSLTSDDAREVVVEVAQRTDISSEYPRMAVLCDPSVLTRVVDIAWRHQFDEDRSGFKREMRDLEAYVARRATSDGEA